MKKIKYLVMAFAAVCFTVGLTSCEKEVEKIVEKPVEVIKEVEKTVEKEVIVEKTDTVKVVEIDETNWAKLLVGHLYQPCCCR